MESNRMKVGEAATLMGCSQETIRLGLIQGVFPWGYAVKTSDKFTYVIIRDKFMSDIRGNKREVIELVGAINSLRNLRKICIEHNGSCKECPLGDAENVQNTSCPCLTKPNSWTDEKTTEMVKMIN
jgi:hypothetical protein